MKLTTARLKKLIREEFEKMQEVEENDQMYNDLYMTIMNIANIQQGIGYYEADSIAQELIPELRKSNPGYSLNVSKGKDYGDTYSEEGKVFMTIVNIGKKHIPEERAAKLAKQAAPEILKVKAGKGSKYALYSKKRIG